MVRESKEPGGGVEAFQVAGRGAAKKEREAFFQASLSSVRSSRAQKGASTRQNDGRIQCDRGYLQCTRCSSVLRCEGGAGRRAVVDNEDPRFAGGVKVKDRARASVESRSNKGQLARPEHLEAEDVAIIGLDSVVSTMGLNGRKVLERSRPGSAGEGACCRAERVLGLASLAAAPKMKLEGLTIVSQRARMVAQANAANNSLALFFCRAPPLQQIMA